MREDDVFNPDRRRPSFVAGARNENSRTIRLRLDLLTLKILTALFIIPFVFDVDEA